MINWIERITDTINLAFQTIRVPLIAVPPLLLICETMNRPGMSAAALTSAIIKSLGQSGINIGPNKDGSANKTCKLVSDIVNNFIDELHNNARVDSCGDIGCTMSVGTGGNAGGPVVVTSTNINPITLHGFIR